MPRPLLKPSPPCMPPPPHLRKPTKSSPRGHRKHRGALQTPVPVPEPSELQKAKDLAYRQSLLMTDLLRTHGALKSKYDALQTDHKVMEGVISIMGVGKTQAAAQPPQPVVAAETSSLDEFIQDQEAVSASAPGPCCCNCCSHALLLPPGGLAESAHSPQPVEATSSLDELCQDNPQEAESAHSPLLEADSVPDPLPAPAVMSMSEVRRLFKVSLGSRPPEVLLHFSEARRLYKVSLGPRPPEVLPNLSEARRLYKVSLGPRQPEIPPHYLLSSVGLLQFL